MVVRLRRGGTSLSRTLPAGRWGLFTRPALEGAAASAWEDVIAFVEAQRFSTSAPRTGVPTVPQAATAWYEPMYSDNFA